jgi:threonylcarbamoyladenosine tRNA methylthiotransferase MtaB
MDHLSTRYQFNIHTYGCKVNTYDTGLLQARLNKKAVQASPASSEATASEDLASGSVASGSVVTDMARKQLPMVHILNTCAVTAEATREAAKQVRRLKVKDPLAKIVVTGCGAQVDGEVFDQLAGVDLVVANSHKGQIESLIDRLFIGDLSERVFRSNIFRKDDLEAGGGTEAGHTRTFLKIQDGCNSFCSYCVIPFARGKSRSIPVAELIKRVRELRAQGISEVVLTGVHIGDYEDRVFAKARGLAELVAEILARTDVPRLRLSSLEPPELTPELLAVYRESHGRLCPHFHMSIQSANTRVLSAMKRKYSAEAVENSLFAIREQLPNAFIGMDVITGFPGETEDEFADTYQRLERLPWTRIHVFPYSERPGTKAATYPDAVERSVRVMRSARLRELSSSRYEAEARKQIGLVKKVLVLKLRPAKLNSPDSNAAVETGSPHASVAHVAALSGLSRDYWPIRFESGGEVTATLGEEMEAMITGFDDSQASRMDGVLLARPLLSASLTTPGAQLAEQGVN